MATATSAPFDDHSECVALTTLVQSGESDAPGGRTRGLRRRQSLWLSEPPFDRVYRLESGRLSIIGADDAGRELVLRTIAPGEWFGDYCRCPGQLWPHPAIQARAEEDCRLVALPPQQLPDLAQVPQLTVLSLLLMAAPVAGVVEEAAFRGYIQGRIERRYGLAVAILITGTMFAVAHLDFTLILWPYYVAVAAIYGTVTYLVRSILPAVVLHTAGNTYSNFDLWLHGQAEWQAASGPATLIWTTGADRSFWVSIVALLLVSAATVWAYFALARATRPAEP